MQAPKKSFAGADLQSVLQPLADKLSSILPKTLRL